MVAGIDGAGTVLASTIRAGRPGDRVVHNGWGVGETRWGCLARARGLKGDWLVALPSAFSTRQAMAIGTAGYTAMLCRARARAPRRQAGRRRGARHRRERRRRQRRRRAARARSAIASSPRPARPSEAATCAQLGAAEVIDRAELAAPGKPLQKERWAAAIDAVGSHTLANALAQTRYGGIVAACGLAQGHDLPATVMPFILRGVTLAGIDSVMAPLAPAQQAWRAARARPRSEALDLITEEVRARRRDRQGRRAAGRQRARADRRRDLAARRRRQRISCDSRLNFGCSLVPSHFEDRPSRS